MNSVHELKKDLVLLNQFLLVNVQVQLVQTVIDGVNYLIECEKKLEKGQDIRIPPPVSQFK